jgi:hypothetical protein
MGQEYKVDCSIEWDNDELKNEFITFVKNNKLELGLADISEGSGEFTLYQYRGVDYSLIEKKLKEMHTNYPNEFFVFNSYVSTEISELGLNYDFGHEEYEIAEKFLYDDDEQGKVYDYCESCASPVNQIEVEDGVFGCPHCKSQSQISIVALEDTKNEN